MKVILFIACATVIICICILQYQFVSGQYIPKNPLVFQNFMKFFLVVFAFGVSILVFTSRRFS